MAIVDPEIDVILQSGMMPNMEYDYSDTAKAVQQMRDLLAAWTAPLRRTDGIKLEHPSYTARDGFQNRMLVFSPSNASADSKPPVVAHLHGG